MIANYSDHAANERTFLAWVRTAMALVGFGLAIGHIGGGTERPATGVMLVGAGLAVVLLAFVRMRMMGRRIDAAGAAQSYGEGAHGAVLVAMMAAMFVLVVAFGLHIV